MGSFWERHGGQVLVVVIMIALFMVAFFTQRGVNEANVASNKEHLLRIETIELRLEDTVDEVVERVTRIEEGVDYLRMDTVEIKTAVHHINGTVREHGQRIAVLESRLPPPMLLGP